MFVKKCEALTASMVSRPLFTKKLGWQILTTSRTRVHLQPDTVIPDTPTGQSPALQAAAQTQPGLATNAAGAAGALAGWAFASVSKKVSHLRFTKDIEGKGRPLKKHLGNHWQLSSAELAAPIEKQVQSPSASLPVTPGINGESRQGGRLSVDSNGTDGGLLGAAGGLSKPAEDWGGDLMDVHDDDGDWSACLPPPPKSVAYRLLIARLPIYSRQTNSRRERSRTHPSSKSILWLPDSRRLPEEDDRNLHEEAVLVVAAARCASELRARTLHCGCRWTWTLLTAGTSTDRTRRLQRRRRWQPHRRRNR